MSRLSSSTIPQAPVVAPTRPGKGVDVVIPNLLALAGIVVVLDVKGENAGEEALRREPADFASEPLE